MPARLDIRDAEFEAGFQRFLAHRRDSVDNVDGVVADIIADVRARGDAAIAEYSRRFDRVELTAATFRIGDSAVKTAIAQCEPDALAALDTAAARIGEFHRRQKPADLDYVDEVGIRLGYRWTAIASVGLYVPGGTAAYPSSVLMNAIPARVAGVERLVMVVPTPDGRLNPLVLAAASLAGITEIYRIGGAQAIAALAFGSDTITPVDKIVGPGNAYVAAAKRQVFGAVGIDMIAGPSEVVIVADGHNDAGWIAADLLAQAEHDEAAQSILITDDAALAAAVERAVAAHLSTLPRRSVAEASWRNHGGILVVEHLCQALPLIDRIAPEHLQLAIDNPDELAWSVRNAGSIFLGRFTPEALGDYVAGPNHVLPTGRSARFSSGLGVLDFLKRSTFLGCDSAGLARIGPVAHRLAEAEGLDAHARSIAIRLNQREGS